MSQALPLTALKAFEAAARLLSFKRAAQELNVTPTAVSHQIQHLEEVLGTKLFRRLPGGLELTAAGEVALPSLQAGFYKLTEAIDLIGNTGTGDVLTVLAPPSFAMRWLIPRLHRFAMAHPDIDVRVSTRMQQFGYRSLGGNRPVEPDTIQGWCEEIDVVVGFGGTRDYAGLATTPLFPLTLTPLCAPELLPSPDPSSDTGWLIGRQLLHDDRGLMYERQSYWDQWLQAHHVTGIDANVGIHFSHSILALQAAAEGLGITVSSPALAREDLRTGRLVKPFPLEIALTSSYFLASNEIAAGRDAVRIFGAWASAEAAEERVEHARVSDALLLVP